MKKLALLAALSAVSLFAQTQTIVFRAVLSPANENPAISDYAASGTGTVWVHVVRQNGKVVSGSVDFQIDGTFPGEATITGTHIHSGAAGVNGPVVIDSGVNNRDKSVAVPATGTVSYSSQGQVTSDAGLAAIEGLLADPSQYYLNVHTTTYAGGVMRGQVQRADMLVLMGMMSPSNELPAINKPGASALGAVTVLATRNSSGALTTARVIFDASYAGLPDSTLSGFHIHAGGADVNGPVTINTGLRSQAAGTSGSGTLHFEVEVNPGTAAQVDTINGLFSNPNNYYINIHTTEFAGGVVRSQLYNPAVVNFPVTMATANEIPAVNLNASGPAKVTAYLLRNPDATVAAGMVVFDVNYRFPAPATITGLHIHDGKIDANGSVTINTGLSGTNSIATDGIGNTYKTVLVTGGAGLATLNSMLQNPENHYVNLHTTDNPGGVFRSQLMPPNTEKPAVTAAISAVSDPTLASAPLGLITIFGRNLSKVPADLSGIPNLASAPKTLNGTSVFVGAGQAAILYIGPDYMTAQLPADAAQGVRNVLVRNSNGDSSTVTLTVNSTAAPGIFFDAQGAVVIKGDGSYVGAGNPARAGDTLVFFGVGLGQTTPPLASGQAAPGAPFAMTQQASVTIGGKNAQVLYSLAIPGYIGLYQIAVQMPAGVTGTVPLVLSVAGVNSNSARIVAQ